MIPIVARNDLDEACLDIDDQAFSDRLDKYEQPIARLALFQQRDAIEESVVLKYVTMSVLVCLLDL